MHFWKVAIRGVTFSLCRPLEENITFTFFFLVLKKRKMRIFNLKFAAKTIISIIVTTCLNSEREEKVFEHKNCCDNYEEKVLEHKNCCQNYYYFYYYIFIIYYFYYYIFIISYYSFVVVICQNSERGEKVFEHNIKIAITTIISIIVVICQNSGSIGQHFLRYCTNYRHVGLKINQR